MQTQVVTSARDIRVVPVGTHGARALIFPGDVVLLLGSPADCDEVIKAAVAAKQAMPVDYWPSLYGRVMAGPDGAA